MTQRNISRNVILAAVEAQNYLCAYCRLPFGTVVSTRRGDTIQNLVGDHWKPFSWREDGTLDNCVASCQICNGIKSDRLYDCLEDASREILARRHDKRVRVVFIPVTSSSLDAEQWAREYARWLSEQLLDCDE